MLAHLCSSTLGEVRSAIERLLRAHRSQQPQSWCARLLDVGCSNGEASARYGEILGARPVCGIEVFDQPAAEARGRGIEVEQLDLETEDFPWPSAAFDVVIVNQVLEHLKNVWHPMGEMYRVLRPGGLLVAAVPNLASLHNRVLLALGAQPTSILTFGPHVRGFTRREFERFVAFAGAFRIERSLGAGFYPLPGRWSRPLSLLWPAASHTVVVAARKLGDMSPPWPVHIAEDRLRGTQTLYGPSEPRR